MPSKTVSVPFQNFTNAAMADSTTVTSTISNILYRDSVAIQLQWTGTPNGTFAVQISLDYNPGTPQSAGGPNAGTWTTIPTKDQTGSAPAATGAAGTSVINLSDLAYPWLRVQYTNSSSTGTLNGYIAAKSYGV